MPAPDVWCGDRTIIHRPTFRTIAALLVSLFPLVTGAQSPANPDVPKLDEKVEQAWGFTYERPLETFDDGARPQPTRIGWPGLASLTELPVPETPFGMRLYGGVSDEGIKDLVKFSSLQTLYVTSSSLTDASAKELRKLPDLRHLQLDYNRGITNDGVAELAKIKTLRSLSLSDTGATDAGVRHLRNLPNLYYLNLRFLPITDVSLETVGNLKNLKYLNLHQTKVTDAGLRQLAGLQELTDLHLLFAENIGDGGLKELAGLKKLQRLDLYGTKVTDAGLSTIAQFDELRALNLGGCDISNAGLKHLAGMKKLQRLDLTNTKVSLFCLISS